MVLNDISDESEYNIDDRQFYSQSYNITVKAYIISEEDFVVEEKEKMKLYMSDSIAKRRSYAEASDAPECEIINDYYYRPVTINVVFDSCNSSVKFHLDSNFIVKSVSVENIRNYKVKVNDTPVDVEEFCKDGNKLNQGDEILFYRVNKYKVFQNGKIVLSGYDDKYVQNATEEDVSEEITISD